MESSTASIDYAQEIARILNGLSLREAAQVYEYAVALQTQSGANIVAVEEDDDDWLNDSEDDI